MTVVVLVLLNSFGQLFLKLGTRFHDSRRCFFYLIGYTLFVFSFVLVEIYLRSEPLSSVIYILAINVVVVTVLSFFFLKEKITMKMLSGLFFICIGTVIFILGGNYE
jgi:drug/metabolite transporter (DMT)-like permease